MNDFIVVNSGNVTFETEVCEESNVTDFNFTEYDFPKPIPQLFSNWTWLHYVKIIICIVVIIVALIGNLGVILAVALNTKMRSTINFYLVNLGAVLSFYYASYIFSLYILL